MSNEETTCVDPQLANGELQIIPPQEILPQSPPGNKDAEKGADLSLDHESTELTIFAIGDLVVCAREKDELLTKVRFGSHGFGPFEVTGIIPVPPCTVSTVGHTQWLNLKVPGGSDLIQKVYITPEGMEIGGSKISFSGCWFKKHK